MIKTNSLAFCALLLFSSCKPQSQTTSDNEVKGSSWQNCVYNAPEYELWQFYEENKAYHTFLKEYMKCKKDHTLQLSAKQSLGLVLRGDIESLELKDFAETLKTKSDKTLSIPTRAGENGSLGRYTLKVSGRVKEEANAKVFYGVMFYEDFWDFNTQAGRAEIASDNVQFAEKFLSGIPFTIKSAKVPLKINFTDDAYYTKHTDTGEWVNFSEHFLETWKESWKYTAEESKELDCKRYKACELTKSKFVGFLIKKTKNDKEWIEKKLDGYLKCKWAKKAACE